MRHIGLALFLIVSLVVHVGLAAQFVVLPEAVQEERGAGATALEVGSLFNAAASEAVEPKPIRQVRLVKQVSAVEPMRRAISVKNFTEERATPLNVKPVAPQQREAPLPVELTEVNTLEDPDILKPQEAKSVREIVETQTVKPLSATKAVAPRDVKPMLAKLPLAKPIEMVKLEPVRQTLKEITAKVPKKKAKQKKKRQKASKGARKGGKKANKDGARNVVDGSRGKKQQANGRAAVSNYKGEVTSRIKRRLRYPSAAKKRRELGVAVVKFQVNRNGSVQGLRIVKSSGSRHIDKAAQAAVRKASPFPSLPSNVPHARVSFSIPLGFKR